MTKHHIEFGSKRVNPEPISLFDKNDLEIIKYFYSSLMMNKTMFEVNIKKKEKYDFS